jgi:cell division septation protein DedD
MKSGNIKNFQLKVGKAGLIIVVVGMAVLLCTAFLFGVDVGKNIDTYPDKIAALPQKALALVWQPAKIRAAQSAPDNKNGPGKTQTQENIDLTFYNDLTSKKGIPKERPVSEKQPVFSPPQNGEETVTGNFNIEAQSQPGSVNEKTKEKGEPKAKEVAPSVASNTQKFIIQAASLKDKTEANKMNKKIASLGFLSQVIKVEIPGKGIFFRVIVSGFENKVQAQEAALKISKKTGTSCIIKRVDNEAKKN